VHLTGLQQEKLRRGLEAFEKRVQGFMKGENVNLRDMFQGVDFISQTECKAKADHIRKEVIAEVNKLTWLTDPQKVLKDVLADKE
jgi:hypothetical protein